MPFSPESLQFLFENHLRDSREWYADHREDFKTLVVRPFCELTAELAPTLLAIDDQILCDPAKSPRVFRDTRIIKYSKDKSVFRDHVWRSFGRVKEQFEALPSFYVEVSPRGFEYGCGYYQASAQSMEQIRKLIIDGDPLFEKARQIPEKHPEFVLCGESYKRNRFPQYDSETADWLNRKSLYITARSTDFPLLFSEDLGRCIAGGFKALEPFYRLLMKAESGVGKG